MGAVPAGGAHIADGVVGEGIGLGRHAEGVGVHLAVAVDVMERLHRIVAGGQVPEGGDDGAGGRYGRGGDGAGRAAVEGGGGVIQGHHDLAGARAGLEGQDDLAVGRLGEGRGGGEQQGGGGGGEADHGGGPSCEQPEDRAVSMVGP